MKDTTPPSWYLVLLQRYLKAHGHSQRDVNAYILAQILTQSKFTKIQKDT